MAVVVNKADPGPLDPSFDKDMFDITPSDTLYLRSPVQALMIGAGGTVAFVNTRGETVSLTLNAGGPYHIGSTRRIKSTGTTATSIKGIASRSLR